jgi:small-conductance mechanosensitive channel
MGEPMSWREALEPLQDFLGAYLFTVAGTRVTVGSLLLAAAVFLLAWLFSRVLHRTLERALPSAPGEDQIRKGLETGRRLIHYGIMALGLGVALHVLGVNLAALFAAGAVLAVAVGFAMQNIVQNFVSGVILLMERSIQPGDVLEVEGQVVRVVDMRIRATVVRTRDEEEIIVPNSILVQGSVKNFTLRDNQLRLRVPVGVVYGSDMRRVREVLETTARGFEHRVQNREPVVLLKGFGNSSVDWEVSVWTDQPWQALILRSELHEAIWWALKDAGVTIAYPQLDVHFDDDAVEAWRGTTG